MNDLFIESLVSSLEPRPPLRNIRLWLHCGICLMLIAGVVLVAMGLRTDYAMALENGALIWKPGIFLLAWIGSVFLITDLSRPDGRIKPWHYIPIVGAATVLIWEFVHQTETLPASTLVQSLLEPSAGNCLSVISGGGIHAMIMAWMFWFSKTASPKPGLLGALAGFSAGCLSATAYALHCTKDITVYISAYYGAPILALTLIGYLLGRKRLSW